MPTTLRRTQITHTPEVRHALEIAARRWPNESESGRIAHAIAEWAEQADQRRHAEIAQRQALARELSGKYTGVWGSNALAELAEDWPT